MKKYILDTSVFVNPASRKAFGNSPDEAVKSFIKMAKKRTDIAFYMPPLIFNELKTFIKKKNAEELELVIKKRSPNLYGIYLPAAVMDEFVDDIRIRMDKGLRVAEQFAQDNRPDNATKLKQLREKYRAALRAGLLDSKEDFELLMLAKELDATVVSSDEGVLNFADDVGCERLNAARLYRALRNKS